MPETSTSHLPALLLAVALCLFFAGRWIDRADVVLADMSVEELEAPRTLLDERGLSSREAHEAEERPVASVVAIETHERPRDDQRLYLHLGPWALRVDSPGGPDHRRLLRDVATDRAPDRN